MLVKNDPMEIFSLCKWGIKSTVWQEIFGGKNFCRCLKIALGSNFRVFVGILIVESAI